MSRFQQPIGRVLAFALAACSPAQAAVRDATADGFTLENTVEVPTDAMTTWNALVDDVGRWWPSDHTWWGAEGELTIEPRGGGCFCERYGEKQALHMLVTFVNPGVLLRMTGGLGPLQGMGLHGVMEFRLTPSDDGGAAITLFYRSGGYTPDDLTELAPVVDQVQAGQLGALGEYLRAQHETR